MRKKFSILAVAAAFFASCGDSSSSPEEDVISSSSSEEKVESSSNTYIPNGDYGEGYKYTEAVKIEGNLLVPNHPYTCAYHSGNFVWEENTSKLDTSSIKLEGDSLWIGPNPRLYDPEDPYYNTENLSISTDHDGYYGVWKSTGCKRNIETKEITCRPYIGNMSGIAQDMIITKDSVTTITKIDSSALDERFKRIDVGQFIAKLRYDMGDLTEDSLVAANFIQVENNTSIRLNTQTFTLSDASKFDATGMNYVSIYSSNGKSCAQKESMGMVSKEKCLEGDEELLLSGRDHSEDCWLYEEGPIKAFSINNRTEFKDCLYSLLTQETIDFLNANAKYEGN